MRNLKKILSLALALMMILSVTASAAFTDAAKIDADYAEAVEVLNGMEVFQGYEDGSFLPTKAITRAEVAAIIYRIDTKDVEDEDVALYVDSANFSDVKAADWFSGYVGYCANAGYIKGYPDGTFLPNKTVTGFEALAMILRAMGYDAENEFSGAAWSQNIAKIATKAGILDVVKPGQLSLAGTREMIAQLLFDAIQAKTVKFYPAWGYLENATKLADLFALTKVTGDDVNDEWGRPAYKWTYNTGDKKTVFPYTPVATYYTAVTECEVAADFDFTGTKTFDLYVNGYKTSDVLNAIDTVDTIGAQGRQTFVYDLDGTDRIVMIDTFLAKVTDVSDAIYDARGHLRAESEIELTIYDVKTGSTTGYTMKNGKTNYPYETGDMVLVNAYTLSGNRDDNTVKVVTDEDRYCEILGLAKSVDGTQSVRWSTANKHTINGETYFDAAEFNLDEAFRSTATHTWYFDQFNNLIGDVLVQTQYDWAVLKNIWWAGDATTGAGKALGTLIYMDGSENVVEIAAIDGNTTKYSIVDIDIMVPNTTDEVIRIATNAATNTAKDKEQYDIIKGHLYQVETYSDGSVALNEVKPHSTATKIYNEMPYMVLGGTTVLVDENTKFLYRGFSETYSSFYTAVGMNNVPTFDMDPTAAKVDYVLGDDNVADYVYIIGETESETEKQFVLVTEKGYAEHLKYSDVNYWEITLPVPAEDGSVVTLKTEEFTKVVTPLTSISNVGKLFYVTYVDGYATDAIEISTWYEYDTVENKFAEKLNQVAEYSNGVLTRTDKAGWAVNVTKATTVIGTLEADMTDKVVYVLFDGDTGVASKVYVLDINNEINNAPTVPTEATVKFTLTIKSLSDMAAEGIVYDLGYVTTKVGEIVFTLNSSSTQVDWRSTDVVNTDKRVTGLTLTGYQNPPVGTVQSVTVDADDLGTIIPVNFTLYR